MDEETGKLICQLKYNLTSTDWVIIKIAEADTLEEQQALRAEYGETINQRRAWREQINELESSE